jgi:hypothetical protein
MANIGKPSSGFPQELPPAAFKVTSDQINPFGGNATVDLTRLISVSQATTLAINNLSSSIAAINSTLDDIRIAIAGP